MRILVADDNKAVRDGIEKILAEETAWEICGVASDGSEALSKTRELKPDLVLLDLQMPSGNGLDIARAVKQEMPQITVLIMSHNALSAGAFGYIDKRKLSSDIPALLRTIECQVNHP